jgi:predicted lipoprotein with Yx(FWY)xxD motif
MRRRLSRITLPVTLAGVAAIAAGCGGGYTAASGGGDQTASAPTVREAHSKLGTILVDGQGRTLYLFEKDKGSASSCTGACASIWPPLTSAGKAVAGGGLSAAKLGETKRSDGKTEITYAGHPLYTYAGDAKSGDTRGQGLDQFGAEWYVLTPRGSKIDNG